MKCISASSWLEYTVSVICNHHTLSTQLLYTSPIKIWKLSKIVLDCYHNCLNVVNDGHYLRALWNSAYHSAVLKSLNSETTHFWTYELFLLSTYMELVPELMPCIFETPYQHIYIYIYIFIYLYVHIYIYIYLYVHIYNFISKIQPNKH
jgi:hypothetical protein